MRYVAQLLDAGVGVRLVLPDDAAVTAFWRDGTAQADRGLDVHALQHSDMDPLLARLVPGWLRRAILAVLRPWHLARHWRALAERVDVASAGRFVAADVTATTLVRRLARRYPHVVATAALELPAVIPGRAP
jgi:hypothetical protein